MAELPPKRRKLPKPPSRPSPPLTRSAASSPKRVTRSMAREAAASGSRSVLFSAELPTRKKRNKPKQQDQGQGGGSQSQNQQEASASSSSKNSILIEHCTQCDSFVTKATEVKEGLEAKVPDITVTLNPKKPRKGCFEIRKEGGEKFVSLLKMKPPFQPMMDLDINGVVLNIVNRINGQDLTELCKGANAKALV